MRRTPCLRALLTVPAVFGVLAGCSALLPMRNRDAAPETPDGAAADLPTDLADDVAPDAAAPDAPPDAGLGPVLYWRFDEESGTEASDSSGNGLAGIYTGETGTPTPAMEVPSQLMFPDPHSRAFGLVERQAVQLAEMPMALRPPNDVTVSAWYRASAVDVNPTTGAATGSEIVSAGNSYLLRLRATQVEFTKRVAGTGPGMFAQCLGIVTGHLDANWHHLAGVSSASGIKLYLDGTERCSNTAAIALQPILYDQGQSLWVGRHGNGQLMWDFGGDIDEVRIYARVLTPEEIALLAHGGQ
jgi:hypothetical protein